MPSSKTTFNPHQALQSHRTLKASSQRVSRQADILEREVQETEQWWSGLSREAFVRKSIKPIADMRKFAADILWISEIFLEASEFFEEREEEIIRKLRQRLKKADDKLDRAEEAHGAFEVAFIEGVREGVRVGDIVTDDGGGASTNNNTNTGNNEVGMFEMQNETSLQKPAIISELMTTALSKFGMAVGRNEFAHNGFGSYSSLPITPDVMKLLFTPEAFRERVEEVIRSAPTNYIHGVRDGLIGFYQILWHLVSNPIEGATDIVNAIAIDIANNPIAFITEFARRNVSDPGFVPFIQNLTPFDFLGILLEDGVYGVGVQHGQALGQGSLLVGGYVTGKAVGVAVKGVSGYVGGKVGGTGQAGVPFNPNARGVQVGVNPRTLIPAKDLSSLSSSRVRDAVRHAGDHAIIVNRNGRVLNGHHRLSDAIRNNRAIDVQIRGR